MVIFHFYFITFQNLKMSSIYDLSELRKPLRDEEDVFIYQISIIDHPLFKFMQIFQDDSDSGSDSDWDEEVADSLTVDEVCFFHTQLIV